MGTWMLRDTFRAVGLLVDGPRLHRPGKLPRDDGFVAREGSQCDGQFMDAFCMWDRIIFAASSPSLRVATPGMLMQKGEGNASEHAMRQAWCLPLRDSSFWRGGGAVDPQNEQQKTIRKIHCKVWGYAIFLPLPWDV